MLKIVYFHNCAKLALHVGCKYLLVHRHSFSLDDICKCNFSKFHFRYVADKMGGPIEKGQLSNFSWELPLSQIKYDIKSNVLPIGMIKTGIHYHRALLFKVSYQTMTLLKLKIFTNAVNMRIIQPYCTIQLRFNLQALADRIAVGCTLERGDYNRAWNKVMLTDDSDAVSTFNNIPCCLSRKLYLFISV